MIDLHLIQDCIEAQLRRHADKQFAQRHEKAERGTSNEAIDEYETYGSPRLTDDLRDSGVKVGRHRVARLMREVGIRAKKPPRWKKTTNSNHVQPRAPNLVERRWAETATEPNKLWVSDLTYICATCQAEARGGSTLLRPSFFDL